jgi:hypothetical protein
MNVEVLGDDIYYGSSPNTILHKQSRIIKEIAAKARKRRGTSFGDDELLGVDWGAFGTGLLNIGKSGVKAVSKVVSSPTGKSVISAGLASVAGRLNPTEKANLAQAQEAMGLSPQVITGGGASAIYLPQPESSLQKNLPYIIGGVVFLGIVTVLLTKKRSA